MNSENNMSNTNDVEHRGLIAWFTKNGIAANLLMLLIVFAGIISALTINKKLFPEFVRDTIEISVDYPGAAPQEVEEGVLVKIEEAIRNVDGINRVFSFARENGGFVRVEVKPGADRNLMLDDLKVRVDAIAAFPEEIERPIIEKIVVERDVMWLTVFGDIDKQTRKVVATAVRDELIALDEISKVQMLGEGEYEISIEVSEFNLQKYNLSISEIADAIRNSSVNLPGGQIKTAGGTVSLRTNGQGYNGYDFEQIALRTNADGRRLLLSDVATIKDQFVQNEGFARFNGSYAVALRVKSVDGISDIKVSKAVRRYVEQKRSQLDNGVELQYWGDSSFYLQERLGMMTNNMLAGALLVFVILALFLNIRIAFWVILGIPVSFFGAVWLMPLGPFAVNIDLVSLFAFILVLGIVVDDAIVIGESVCTEIQAEGHSIDNVIAGAKRVAMPATFGVLTTIAAFAPMLMVGGQSRAMFEAISVVVILCLAFSLVESKLILPAHLARIKFKSLQSDKKSAVSEGLLSQWLENINRNHYQPALKKALNARWTTLSMFIAVLLLTGGLISSKFVRYEFFPDVASDFIQVDLSMNEGSTTAARNAAVQQIEAAIETIEKVHRSRFADESKLVQYVMTWTAGDTKASVMLELSKSEKRQLNALDIEKMWRKEVGTLPGVKELKYTASTNSGGDDKLNFYLTGSDFGQLEQASKALADNLRQYEGVFDVRNSYSSASQEINLQLKSEAQNYGLNTFDLATQVRQAFYGEEVQRIQRGNDELKVMVRYPLIERKTIASLENMKIRTRQGIEVPFSHVAKYDIGEGYYGINRLNGKRYVSVTANVDAALVQTDTIIDDLEANFVVQMKTDYSEVHYGLQGSNLSQKKLKKRMIIFFGFGLFFIYALLAVPLKSYGQPLIVMAVIPFGITGALAGHMLLDTPLSMMSFFGMVALSGVIVNDSLMVVDCTNKYRQSGKAVEKAALAAGGRRFRAVVLTSLTTFFGVSPILLERSLQAQLIVPMAIALAFGILFATLITLFLTPVTCVIFDDIKQLLGAKRRVPQVST